jgi:hypothetical protein
MRNRSSRPGNSSVILSFCQSFCSRVGTIESQNRHPVAHRDKGGATSFGWASPPFFADGANPEPSRRAGILIPHTPYPNPSADDPGSEKMDD